MGSEIASGLAIPRRKDVIREHQNDGGKVAAVFPIYFPRELLRAFGYLPVELWGPPGQIPTEGDAHLQPYTCSIVRCGLAFALTGGLQSVDLVVVPHGCDSLQGLGSLLIDFLPPQQPVFTLYLPRGRDIGADRFLAAEIRGFYERLAELTGSRPTDDELMAAIEVEETADHEFAELFRQRRKLPLSDRQFYELVRAREFLPVDKFTVLAREALGRCSPQSVQGVPLVLSGVVPEPVQLLDAISEAGAFVAGDDMICTGRRQYPAGSSSDPFNRMAQRLLGARPDSTAGAAVAVRAAYLQKLVARCSAKAVVFYHAKFCEPEQFYLPLIQHDLEQRGIRSVGIEVDIADPLPQQVVTRLEALLEMVS